MKPLNFALALQLKHTPAGVDPPRRNPAVLWIEQHKTGRSQYQAGYQLNVAARLMGYGDGSTTDYAAVPWHTLHYADILDLRVKLVTRLEDGTYTASVVNHVLDSVKGVMIEVWKLGVGQEKKYIDAEERLIIEDVKRIPGALLKNDRRTITEDEYTRLLAQCLADDSAKGKRDAAIVSLAAQTGLRASEFAALTLADYDAAGRRLRVPQIKVQSSEDDIWNPLEGEVIEILAAWVKERGDAPGAMFPRVERNGVGTIHPLGHNGITGILTRRGDEIGIDNVTCHALRRFFVTRLLQQGSDLSMAQKLVRHMSPQTTAKYYDQRDEQDKRKAIKRLTTKDDDAGD